MLLNELILAFRAKYELECLKRSIPEIHLGDKMLALMLSETVSNLQKKLGVIEISTTKTSSNGVASYSLTSTFMNPKTVVYDGNPLEKTNTQWIQGQYAYSDTPQKYAIEYLSGTPKLLLYPTPSAGGDTILITSNSSYGLYSPSSSSQDFGSFDGSTFSGSTIFPVQYDAAMILGMMKQLFRDIEPDYDKECRLLRVRQYQGEKLTYKLGQDTEDRKTLTYSPGVTVLNEDFPGKYVRITATYGGTPEIKDSLRWAVPLTVTDDGSKIIITSSGEFTIDQTIVEKNNANADAYQVIGDETNTIYVNYYGVDYGQMLILVRVW